MNKTYLLPFNFISIVIFVSLISGVFGNQILNSLTILSISLFFIYIHTTIQKFSLDDYKKAFLIVLALIIITQINLSTMIKN